MDLRGVSTVHADRNTAAGGKSKGDLILYINHRRCNFTVKPTICCKNIELLAVRIRPYYLPREFIKVLAVCVYIPPRPHVETALETVVTAVTDLQSRRPQAVLVISGDFNRITLDFSLPSMFQYMDCATGGNNTLDTLYDNIREAYKATPLPHLCKSDHILILLLSRYTPLVEKMVRWWTPEAEEDLRECFRQHRLECFIGPLWQWFPN